MPGNPNPNMSGLRPFKPGQSGNPGGITKEQRRRQLETAERASRVRAALVEDFERRVEEALSTGGDIKYTNQELQLLRDSEDRGFGKPSQQVDITQSEPVQMPDVITIVGVPVEDAELLEDDGSKDTGEA